jgi:tetratricopeptide (TPR) repeat protein
MERLSVVALGTILLTGSFFGIANSLVRAGTQLNPANNNLSPYQKAIDDWTSQQSDASNHGVRSSDDLKNLRVAADRSALSAMDRLHLADVIASKGDEQTALVWALSGLDKAIAEIDAIPSRDATRDRLLQQLSDAVKPLRVEPDVSLQERLLALDMRMPRVNNWDQRPEWSRINHVRALISLDRYQDALAEVGQIHADIQSNHKYTDEQKSDLAMLEARALHSLGCDDQAKPLLKAIISTKGTHSQEAASLLNDINLPKMPLAALQIHKPRERDLEIWAVTWQSASYDSRPNSPDNLEQLAVLLEKSDRSAMERLAIGRMTQDGNDTATADIWDMAGITKAVAELAEAQNGANDPAITRRVLVPMLSGFDSAEKVFTQQKDGDALEELCTLEMKVPRLNSSDQRPEWVRIEHTEALMMLLRRREALAELKQIEADISWSGSYFNDDQKADANYVEGQLYTQMGRYSDAIPHVLFAHNTWTYHDRDLAMALLFEDYIHTGRLDKAKAVLVEWKKRFGSSGNAKIMESELASAK